MAGPPQGERCAFGARGGPALRWPGIAVAVAVLAATGFAAPGPPESAACGFGAQTAEPEGSLRLAHALSGARQLCFHADPGVELDPRDGRIRRIPPGGSLDIATVGVGHSRELRVSSEAGTIRYDWRVDGLARPFEAPAQQWMEQALAAVSGLREIAATRAEEVRLRGEIASLRETEAGLRDEIGAILGERGRLQQKIGAIRDEERELRDAIDAIRGEESALRVAIGAERTAIASLTAQLEDAAAGSREAFERERERRTASLQELEGRLRGEDHATRIEALEGRRDALRTGERVAAIEATLDSLDVDDRIADLESRRQSLQARELLVALRRRLDSLDPDARVARIERQIQPLLLRLASAMDGGGEQP